MWTFILTMFYYLEERWFCWFLLCESWLCCIAFFDSFLYSPLVVKNSLVIQQKPSYHSVILLCGIYFQAA